MKLLWWLCAGWIRREQSRQGWTKNSTCETKNWESLRILAEKAMAPHSSSLAWKTPWMEEPGGLQSEGSLRVRHDWVTSLSPSTFFHYYLSGTAQHTKSSSCFEKRTHFKSPKQTMVSPMPPPFTLTFTADRKRWAHYSLQKWLLLSDQPVLGPGIMPLSDLTCLKVYNIAQHFED